MTLGPNRIDIRSVRRSLVLRGNVLKIQTTVVVLGCVLGLFANALVVGAELPPGFELEEWSTSWLKKKCKIDVSVVSGNGVLKVCNGGSGAGGWDCQHTTVKIELKYDCVDGDSLDVCLSPLIGLTEYEDFVSCGTSQAPCTPADTPFNPVFSPGCCWTIT